MDGTLVLKKSKFIFNGNSYTLQDMMTAEFYEFSDMVADIYKTDMYEGNEMFYTFIQQVLAIKKFIQINKIICLKIEKADFKLTCLACSAGVEAKIEIDCNSLKFDIMCCMNTLKRTCYIFTSFLYLILRMMKIRYKGSIRTSCDLFSIVRLNQEYNKYEFLRKRGDVYFDYENIQSTLAENNKATENGSIYNRYKLTTRLGWICKALPRAIIEERRIKEFLREKVNNYCALAAQDFYSKRVVHTFFYAEMIDSVFSQFEGKDYVTGKIIDRYGFIESSFAAKHNIRIINYPHGVEYGFKMPNGLVGDVFYATSQYAADYFNKLYRTDKFKYDFSTQNQIMNRHYKPERDMKRVVFFSEAHEQEVNLDILSGLVESGIKVGLKLHPKESVDYYRSIIDKVKLEKDFDRAITGNVCVARRSTVLIEALYNNSTACAILINENDRAIYKFYPSLQDDRITAFESIDDLISYITMGENNG